MTIIAAHENAQALNLQWSTLSTLYVERTVNEHERLLRFLRAAVATASPNPAAVRVNSRVNGLAALCRTRALAIRHFVADHRAMYAEHESDRVEQLESLAGRLVAAAAAVEGALPSPMTGTAVPCLSPCLTENGAPSVDLSRLQRIASNFEASPLRSAKDEEVQHLRLALAETEARKDLETDAVWALCSLAVSHRPTPQLVGYSRSFVLAVMLAVCIVVLSLR